MLLHDDRELRPRRLVQARATSTSSIRSRPAICKHNGQGTVSCAHTLSKDIPPTEPDQQKALARMIIGNRIKRPMKGQPDNGLRWTRATSPRIFHGRHQDEGLECLHKGAWRAAWEPNT